jgi:uncharacterized protein YbjT (DUF2867 family)
MQNKTLLVLGAAGYVGSRLVPYLLERGYSVKAAGRSLEKLRRLSWHDDPRVTLTACDVFDAASLAQACQGCFAAYYLVHSMNPHEKNFEEADRKAALHMVKAAEEAGLERVIYLAGLGEDRPDLSKHLRSRREVEKILKGGKVPVTVLRAAMIIGAGSASFEILRYLVERLPAMITPRWVSTESQPIGIRNVLHYLAECPAVPGTADQTLEIGGDEIVTYRRLMEIYAEEAHLAKRWVVPVPVLTPRLSSYWIHLVTPIHAAIARPLAEGLRNKVVVTDPKIRSLIPQRLLSAREAVRLALNPQQYDLKEEETLLPAEWTHPADPVWAGGTVFEDRRQVLVRAPAARIWPLILEFGEKSGWYYAGWLWKLRGLLDKLCGGPGILWRAEKEEPEKRLMRVSLMKLPGRAVLDFQLKEKLPGETELTQTARFVPRGLSGLLYWYLLLLFHHLIFDGMLKGIVRRAEEHEK